MFSRLIRIFFPRRPLDQRFLEARNALRNTQTFA